MTRTKIVLLRISMISLEIIFLQDPGAWWMGQIVSYLLRPRQDLKVYSLVPSLFLSVFKYPEKENTEILRLPIIIQISTQHQEVLNQYQKSLGLSRPLVGVHVR